MLHAPLQEFNNGAMAEVELIIYNTEFLEVSLKLIYMCYDRTVLVNITKVLWIKSLGCTLIIYPLLSPRCSVSIENAWVLLLPKALTPLVSKGMMYNNRI